MLVGEWFVNGEDDSTYLSGRVTGHGAKGALGEARGLVGVRAESGSVAVRHDCRWRWLNVLKVVEESG